MSDEVNQITEELKKQGVPMETKTSTETEQEYSPLEQEQLQKGWDPKGEKSAEEWQRQEHLYTEIKKRGKQIKGLSRTIDELKNHMDKASQLAYEKAMADLKREKIKASRSGDYERMGA